MMFKRQVLFASSACLLAGLAATMATAPAHAAGSIKAAYVEQVIPAHTYTGHMTLLNATNSIGPGTGILGITSI
ncbi:hypothetical protein ABTK65_20590, partial [Acinetobacter baumannii]